jgi:hypothetical protein
MSAIGFGFRFRVWGLRFRPNALALDLIPDVDVFYLFLQKKKIALGHIPFGYSPPMLKHTLFLTPNP